LSNLFIWTAVFSAEERTLTVAFLDVGQGDTIFIEAPNGNQLLLDGGPNRGVLTELSRHMNFFDHSIDVVIASHPDKDHIAGLPEVLRRYDVGAVLEPGVEHGTAVYATFQERIKEEGAVHILARRGQRIILDEGIYLDILFPDREVTSWDTNDASIIARLVYGDISFLLTGDSPQKMERYVAGLYGEGLHTTVLKLGHHGSRTSSSEEFLGFVDPDVVIISAGKDNQYGHPHKEVMDLLARFGIPSRSTAQEGSIIFKTDGLTLTTK